MSTSFRLRVTGSHALFAVALAIGVGLGCGGNGLGCGGSSGLPADPKPWGFPMNQAIEGGLQARITRPGFDKISALVPALTAGALPTQQKPQCMGVQQQSLKIAGTGGDVRLCNRQCGGGAGCPVWVDLRKDIAPPGGIALSMADGGNPVVKVDAAFDVNMQIPIEHRFCIFGICQGWQNDCTMSVKGPGTHINADIQLGIDPTTGKLTIALGALKLLGLNLGVSDCGLLSDIFNFVVSIVNSIAKSFIGDAIINLLKPQLTQLIAGFLPNPPGLTTRIDTASQLASFGPPKEAALELMAIAGGYVSARGGGLNLGVIAGANSDKDPMTRASGADPINSQPSLCVPLRPTYDLGKAPWNLAQEAQRGSYILDVAPEFAGMPDPVDGMGAVQDVAIGVSRTFLDVTGFHLYNSGTLCLSIGQATLGSMLSLDTLSLLMPSLNNIKSPKAPVALTLRPQQPLVFTLGAGTAGDALLKIGATDLRIDFYGLIEERYVRLFTMAADLNIGVDLAVTMTKEGQPALQPMLSGLDSKNITIRVTNTDLLGEEPKALAGKLGTIVDLAVGQLGGAIAPIALPSLMGFSLDGLQLRRVQTSEDDFLAILGTLKQDPKAMPFQLPEETVGIVRQPASIDTYAQVVDVQTPPPEVIRQAVGEGRKGDGDTPGVTLRLGGTGRDMEWSYRVDGGWWRPWSKEARPTIFDPAFVLQGRHSVEVRAREAGDFLTEDLSPARVEVVIDSVPPELQLAVDKRTRSVAFRARDNVSEPGALRYAWKAPEGWTRPSARDYLTFDEAWAATKSGTVALEVAAFDELGNQAIGTLSDEEVNGFHGRTQAPPAAGGCGCEVAARRGGGDEALGWLSALALGGLVVTRRRRWAQGRGAARGREAGLA